MLTALYNAVDAGVAVVRKLDDDLELFETAGVTPPEAARLRASLDWIADVAAEPPNLDADLADAVRSGDQDRMRSLLLEASAWSASTLEGRRMTITRTVPVIAAEITALLDEAAPAMLAELVERFNTAGAALGKAAATINLGMPAEDALRRSKAEQTAWAVDAPAAAATLDALADLLLRAASRCGRWWTKMTDPTGIPTLVEGRDLAALVDIGDLDAELALDTWTAGGHRLGRFAAMADLGARVRVPETPEEWAALAVPRRPEYTTTWVPAGQFGGRTPVRHRVGQYPGLVSEPQGPDTAAAWAKVASPA